MSIMLYLALVFTAGCGYSVEDNPIQPPDKNSVIAREETGPDDAAIDENGDSDENGPDNTDEDRGPEEDTNNEENTDTEDLAPVIAATIPEHGDIIDTSISYLSVIFSEPVKAADGVPAVTVTGEGAGTLSVGPIDDSNNEEWTLFFSGTPGNGLIEIELLHVTDMAGNLLTEGILSFTGLNDAVLPYIESTVPGDGSIITKDLPHITVIFSEAVTGADNIDNYEFDCGGSVTVENITIDGNNTYVLDLSGEFCQDEARLLFSNITDLYGNGLTDIGITFTVDQTAPEVASVSPLEGSVIDYTMTSIDIMYTEEVHGARDAGNYRLAGDGAGGLAVSGITCFADNSCTISVSGTPDNGEVLLQISGVSDIAGNGLATGPLSFTGYSDSVAPAISLIDPPAGSIIDDTVGQFVVEFSEAVDGALDHTKYVFSGTGSGTLSIDSVTVAGANTYTLHTGGHPVNGPLIFEIHNITDTAGNPLEDSTVAYTGFFDADAPSIMTVTPASGSYVSGSFDEICLIFSEDVDGAETVSNYGFAGPGAATLGIDTVTVISSSEVCAALSGTPADGLIYFNMQNIEDLSGNTLAGPGYITFYGDVTQPEPVSLTPAAGSTVDYTLDEIVIMFSEKVTGASNSDNYYFSGDGSGSFLVAGVTELSASEYSLSITGMPSNGELMLNMENITDRAGNGLLNSAIEYSGFLDVDSPFISASMPAADTTIGLTLTEMTIQFSEEVTGVVTTGNYSITGAGAGTLAVAGVTDNGGDHYTLNLSGSPVGGTFSVTLNNIHDLTGNPLSGNVLTCHVDDIQPEIAGSVPADGSYLNRSHDTIVINFSEEVTGADNSGNYVLTGTGVGTLSIDSATVAPSGATAELSLSGYPGPDRDDITLTVNNIADRYGNVLSENTLEFLGDGLGPEISNTSPAEGSVGDTVGDVIITFSETVDGADNISNYRLDGSGSADLTIDALSVSGTDQYTLTITGNTENGEIIISIDNITDIAGNELENNTITYIRDLEPPSVTSDPAAGANISKTEFPLTMEVQFSEEVTGANIKSNYVLSGPGKGGLMVVTVIDNGGNSWLIYIGGNAGMGRLTLTINSIYDLEGNEMVDNSFEYHIVP